MHIVWVLKSYWDTISDRATWVEMSHALEARGHRVTVITGYRARRDPHGLTDVIFVPSLKVPYLNQITQAISAAGALGRLLRRRQPDVVIVDAQAWLSALPYAALARLSRRRPRFVLDVRTVPVDLRGLKGRVIDAVFWAGLRTANCYYNGASAITPYMAQTLRTRYGITLPLGIWSSAVSLATFDPAAVAPQKVASLRAQFRVADGDMLLLYHGSYGVYRGLVNLIQAMVEVRATLPGAVLVLLGSGRVADDLQRLIVRLGLRGAVVLHPPVPHDQVPAYIAAADLGVLPFPRLRWWRVRPLSSRPTAAPPAWQRRSSGPPAVGPICLNSAWSYANWPPHATNGASRQPHWKSCCSASRLPCPGNPIWPIEASFALMGDSR